MHETEHDDRTGGRRSRSIHHADIQFGRFAVAHRGALSRPDRDSGQHAATRRITTLLARSEVPLRPIRLASWSRRQEAADAERRSYVNREPQWLKMKAGASRVL